MAARFEARSEHLAQLLAIEVGKILPHARFETATVPFNLRFNAALALTDYGRAAEVDEDSLSIVIRQPVGVAGIFAPWNAPIALGIRSLAPALAAIAVTATAVLVTMSTASYEQDVFSRTAERLSPVLSRSGPLVTAAPDAYSFWLPTQTVRAMRPGVRGQILLDPAQRAYAPQLGARGRVVARVSSDFAFSRPDGEIDPGDAVLVEGRVTEARADAAAAAPAP